MYKGMFFYEYLKNVEKKMRVNALIKISPNPQNRNPNGLT